VTEKIEEWQLAAVHLKPALPNDDEVHESWVNQMESFMKEFPLLKLLSNDALKVGLLLCFLSPGLENIFLKSNKFPVQVAYKTCAYGWNVRVYCFV
jgi:hypothetical protein